MYDEAITLAEEGEWEDLCEFIGEYPSVLVECQDDFGMTALHWACTEPSIPVREFQTILNAYPNACSIRNQSGMFPLHVAISSRLPGVHLDLLLKCNPASSLVQDGSGKYPAEIAASKSLPNHSVQLIKQTAHKYANGIIASEKPETNNSPSLGRISELAALMDSKVPTKDVGELSMHLQDLVGQLRQLSVDMKCPSDRSSIVSSASTTSLSSDCTSASSSSPETGISVNWSPENKLGVSFESVSNKCGARVKRITDSAQLTTPDVRLLSVGDLLCSVNNLPVENMPFSKIVQAIKSVNGEVRFEFKRGVSVAAGGIVGGGSISTNNNTLTEKNTSVDSALYNRVSELLSKTMKTVEEAEDTIRMSVAMSLN